MNKENLKDVVYCDDCGILLKKSYASSVEVEFFGGESRTIYYCEKHKKPYDIRHVWRVCRDVYYRKKVEVDSKGNLIK